MLMLAGAISRVFAAGTAVSVTCTSFRFSPLDAVTLGPVMRHSLLFVPRLDTFEIQIQSLRGLRRIDDGHRQRFAVAADGCAHIQRIRRTAGVDFRLVRSHRIQRRRDGRGATHANGHGAEVVPVQLEDETGGAERGAVALNSIAAVAIV